MPPLPCLTSFDHNCYWRQGKAVPDSGGHRHSPPGGAPSVPVNRAALSEKPFGDAIRDYRRISFAGTVVDPEQSGHGQGLSWAAMRSWGER
jgi:hypothetical protein